jgi:hypothetical protein
MAKQRKRGGRVTPKGTQPTTTEKRPKRPIPGKAEVTHQRDLPGQVRRPQDFGTRPISHNRGNR